MSKRAELRCRRAARAVAGAASYVPVHVVEGAAPPRLVGQGYYHTTPSGRTLVQYPGAYGWPTRYWPSTRRVEVGRDSVFAVAWRITGVSP